MFPPGLVTLRGGGTEDEVAGHPELARPAGHAGLDVLTLLALLRHAGAGLVVLRLLPGVVLDQAAQTSGTRPVLVSEPSTSLSVLRKQGY